MAYISGQVEKCMIPLRGSTSFNPGKVLIKDPSPAKIKVELLPRGLYEINKLRAVVSWTPKVFKSLGKLLTFEVKENPLPSKSINIKFATFVNRFAFGTKLRFWFNLTGPMLAIP